MISIQTNAEPHEQPFVVAVQARAERLLRRFRKVSLTDRCRFPIPRVELLEAAGLEPLPVLFFGSGEVWTDDRRVVTVNAVCGAGSTPFVEADEREVLDHGRYRHTRRVAAFVSFDGMPIKTWCTTPVKGETDSLFGKVVGDRIQGISRSEWLDLHEQWEVEAERIHTQLLASLARRLHPTERRRVALDVAADRERAATACDRRLGNALLQELRVGNPNEC